jgi:hypothetical protein
MTLFDKLAWGLAGLAILLSAWVASDIYEGLAQLEDEYAYHWQARLLTQLKVKVPSPPESQEFVIPFVIDEAGERFSKYPLGWPIMLSFGERLGFGRWVNPILAGLAVWLTYLLGKALIGDRSGFMAALLTVISPLFLTYSGSILAHTWGLVLTLSLAIAWLKVVDQNQTASPWPPVILAGFSLGVLTISRPYTAVGVAIPFGVHGVLKLWQGSPVVRKKIIGVGVITAFIGSLHFLWQYALTGDAMMNPYLLWWPYDRIGFGPGFGVADQGHTLHQAWVHTKNSLKMTFEDLWGWGIWVWILPLIGLWTARRRSLVLLIASVFPSLVLVYAAYWVSGPRYFYEGLFSLTILGAVGIARIGGWWPEHPPPHRWNVLRQGIVLVVFAGLIVFGTLRYAPTRLNQIKNRYGFSQAALEPFRTQNALDKTPALVIVHTKDWGDYGVYLHLQNPTLTSPFIFAWAAPQGNPTDRLAPHYPDRAIYHYYPDQPGEFYRHHLP